MDPIELGIDRTVVSMWAPDDSWPALLDEYAVEPPDARAPEATARFGQQRAGGGGRLTASRDEPIRTDVDVPQDLVDTVAPIPDEPVLEESVQAVAAIDGHPLHPVVVPLPIGAFVGAFAADVAYLRTHDRFWARSARVLTAAGLATGALAGTLGAVDFTGRRRIRRHASAWVHAGGNAAVLGLALASIALRGRDERAAVARGGLAISAASAGLLLLTGWLGGELAYRERIGVIPR
jgi:uncharacterized membrane protein